MSLCELAFCKNVLTDIGLCWYVTTLGDNLTYTVGKWLQNITDDDGQALKPWEIPTLPPTIATLSPTAAPTTLFEVGQHVKVLSKNGWEDLAELPFVTVVKATLRNHADKQLHKDSDLDNMVEIQYCECGVQRCVLFSFAALRRARSPLPALARHDDHLALHSHSASAQPLLRCFHHQRHRAAKPAAGRTRSTRRCCAPWTLS